MHCKLMLIDDQAALVGSANLDNRSLRLNFEAGVLLPDPPLVAELEKAYQHDLEDAAELSAEAYARRSLWAQILENACRLFSPTL